MGYDIIAGKNKNNNLYHIQCQYGYQPIFKRALGYDIQKLHGRLVKNDIFKRITEIDKIIHVLKTENINVPMFMGNLANCSKENLIYEFNELKKLIIKGKIGYLNIS